MSTSQSLPIQSSLPAKGGPSALSPQETDSEGVFNEVLSDELDSASVELSDEVASSNLPLDGKDLPLEGDTEVSLDILDIAELEASLDVTADDSADILALAQIDDVIINPAVASVTSKDFSGTSEAILKQADVAKPENVIRFVNSAGLVPNKAEVTNQLASLQPYSDSGLEMETQAVTKFKESLQLQKSISPLVKQAEFGQIGRVIEQFSEFNQKSIAPAPSSVSTLVNATPLSSSTGTAATIGAAQLSVEVPVQDQRWQKAFSQRVVWSVGNVQSAQLRLNPAELGRIDIQVNIDKDKASVVFNAQNGVVKEAIEQALPRLREMLAEQGVELEKAEIFNENFNQQQASAQNDSSEQKNAEADSWSGIAEDEILEESHVSQIELNDDIVDYYV